MYLTIEETASYLDVSINDVLRWIHDRQVRFVSVDDVILLNQDQFDFFLKQREKAIKEYQTFLDTPLPDDIDIKDED